MNEQSVQCGNGLQGIYINAADARMDTGNRPVFVLINAGYQHSVGPYRLYTDLARNLAASGFDSLRFDLPGIGNSREELPIDSIVECKQGVCTGGVEAQSCIQEALAMLEQAHGAQEFVLCGLCSGADDALQMVGIDPRIVGVVPIDSAGFRAGKFNLHHYLVHYPRRLVSVSKWRGLLEHRKLAKAMQLSTTVVAEQSFSANDGYRALLSPESFRRTVAGLIESQCNALFIYTGGVAHYYNHESQFSAMTGDLELGGSIDVAYYPKADHLLFVSRHRQALINDISEWANRRWLLSASSAPAQRAA